MPYWVMELLGWLWLGVIGLLPLVALRSPRKSERVLLVFMSWATIWTREDVAHAVLRSAIWGRRGAPLNANDFRDGGVAILDYLVRTAPQILIPVVALGLVAIWGRDGGSAVPERARGAERLPEVVGGAFGVIFLSWPLTRRFESGCRLQYLPRARLAS
jgi:hypothetical protein